MDAISNRTCRAGGGAIVEWMSFGRRMRRGGGMIGESPMAAAWSAFGALEEGGVGVVLVVTVAIDVIGVSTGLRLTCWRCGWGFAMSTGAGLGTK